jgi:hypothetical protein
MTPRDAFFNLVSDYPGGADALAPRLGISPWTLRHKADPKCTTHKPGLEEVIKAELLSGDHRPLHAHNEALGYRCLRIDHLPHVADEDLLQAVNAFAKETGEALAAMSAAIEDGKITENEIRRFERQVADIAPAAAKLADLMRAIAAEQSRLRAVKGLERVA